MSALRGGTQAVDKGLAIVVRAVLRNMHVIRRSYWRPYACAFDICNMVEENVLRLQNESKVVACYPEIGGRLPLIVILSRLFLKRKVIPCLNLLPPPP